jgi:hypothetical protein
MAEGAPEKSRSKGQGRNLRLRLGERFLRWYTNRREGQAVMPGGLPPGLEAALAGPADFMDRMLADERAQQARVIELLELILQELQRGSHR